MDVLSVRATSMSRSTRCLVRVSEKAKRERRLRAHSIGRILKPSQ